MAEDCKPELDNKNTTISSKLSSGAISVNGELTLNAISQFEQNFTNSTVAQQLGNGLTNVISLYGNDAFFESVNTINTFINDPLVNEIITSNKEDYDVLYRKIEMANPISPLEYAQFLTDYNYSPSAVNTATTSDINNLIANLAAFFNGSFLDSILGGFCGKLAKPFAAATTFFTLANAFQKLDGDKSYLNKIVNLENPAQVPIDKITVEALIEESKSKLVDLVDKQMGAIEQKISNFDITNFTSGEIFTDPNLLAQIDRKKQQALSNFNEEVKTNLEAKVKGLVDYAVNIIDNPSPEAVLFLTARLCGLGAALEDTISQINDPFENLQKRYSSTGAVISARSNLNTAKALASGAVRLSPEQRQEMINSEKDKWEQENNTAAVTPDERKNILSYDSIAKGTNGKITAVSTQWINVLGAEGWNGIDEKVKVRLLRVQKDFGKELTLLSGKRTVEYQALLRRQAKERGQSPGPKGDYGVSFSSLHLSGKAVDISTSGWSSSEKDDFLEKAKENDRFTGIGFYSWGFHLDIGPKRSWGSRTS